MLGRYLLALAGVLVCAAGPAAAVEDADLNYDTTEDLYQVCSTPADQPEHAAADFACRAFIEATAQYHDEVTGRKNMKRLICYPATATVADGQAAFVSWANANKDNAKLMGEQPVIGVVRALAAKFPCR
ncbi:MAG: hypothetical protein LJE69_20500 [Thiohalocapsa sp.]|jgi:hypothetical protein|uniref:Rap1a/Tai family immunity protein n=1 Tax=Thiohalocapsa sp. TaxID=2497641 RepID=UPI0025CC0B2F|nr:Rap1a/Tai family immunity protein [Thiohalocapsa sp.]MCG6943618.1 hypothetical protein [Thiohalocapsa sp.]